MATKWLKRLRVRRGRPDSEVGTVVGSDAEPLDEFGLPWSWRRDPPFPELTDLAPAWEVFRRWCEDRGIRAFPASVETVLAFVREAPVEGEALYRVWRAVDVRHDHIYWNVGANPVLVLEARNIKVHVDGRIEGLG